jgi:hypothetical protein
MARLIAQGASWTAFTVAQASIQAVQRPGNALQGRVYAFPSFRPLLAPLLRLFSRGFLAPLWFATSSDHAGDEISVLTSFGVHK